MTANLPIIGSIATIQAVDVVPANGFEWAKLALQFVLGIFGYLHHRRLAKNQTNDKK
jgi:hypothetical protein